METIVKVLKQTSGNPSAFVSLLSAVIAASIALLVFAITQFLTRKRERTQFLTPKLEELYLLINKVAEDNARLLKLMYLCIDGNEDSLKTLASLDELELYGHLTAKRIIMYIRLYFPRLSTIHQRLFAAQRKQNQLLFLLYSKTPPHLEDVIDASGRVGHFLRLVEDEIIKNRDHLLRDYLFLKRYKETIDAEIAAEMPRPNGSVMSETPS